MTRPVSSAAEAAMRALCDRCEAPTMEELAAVAGVSVRTLYRLYGSRDTLLRELDREPSAGGARKRIMEAALDIVGERGFRSLSMDELAATAGVSRATLYRVFPGKPALLGELVQTFSPWIPLARVIETAADPSPEQVVPNLAHALRRALTGRTGLLLGMVSQMADGEPANVAEVNAAIGHALGVVFGYLDEQMRAGRLRRLHPVLAFQLLAGPIVTHLLARPLTDRGGQVTITVEDAVDELVHAWMRAMAPDTPV